MQVKVGDATYGWGSDAKDLPNDPHAFGAKMLTEEEVVKIVDAIRDTGHETFAKRQLEESQVFLIEPKVWRRPIAIRGLEGQILQVRKVEGQVQRPPTPEPATTTEPTMPGTPPETPEPGHAGGGGAVASTPDATGDDGEPDPNAGKGDENPEPPKEAEGA